MCGISVALTFQDSHQTVSSAKEAVDFEGSYFFCLGLCFLSTISSLRLPICLFQLSDLWLIDSALQRPNERETWVGGDSNRNLPARDGSMSHSARKYLCGRKCH